MPIPWDGSPTFALCDSIRPMSTKATTPVRQEYVAWAGSLLLAAGLDLEVVE